MTTVAATRGVAHQGVGGSVRVRERALERAVREASAHAIGVSRGDVRVELAE